MVGEVLSRKTLVLNESVTWRFASGSSTTMSYVTLSKKVYVTTTWHNIRREMDKNSPEHQNATRSLESTENKQRIISTKQISSTHSRL